MCLSLFGGVVVLLNSTKANVAATAALIEMTLCTRDTLCDLLTISFTADTMIELDSMREEKEQGGKEKKYE